jgi:hypothetical protein
MYERVFGSNYDPEMTSKDCAAAIRKAARTALKDGTLPAGWTVSVRYTHSSLHSAVDVVATAPGPIYAADPTARDEWLIHAETGEWVHGRFDSMTLDAQRVETWLTELHRSYNHDGSDTQTDYFDVKFYGTVQVRQAEGLPFDAVVEPSFTVEVSA